MSFMKVYTFPCFSSAKLVFPGKWGRTGRWDDKEKREKEVWEGECCRRRLGTAIHLPDHARRFWWKIFWGLSCVFFHDFWWSTLTSCWDGTKVFFLKWIVSKEFWQVAVDGAKRWVFVFFLIGVKESICRLSVAHAGLVEASLDTVNQATGGGNFVEEIKEMKRIGCEIGSHLLTFDTVHGRNPKQPPGMYKSLQIMG